MFNIAITFAYILLFVFLIAKIQFFRIKNIPKYWIVIAFLIKIAAGFILTYIYTYYYTDRSLADIYKYFDDSKILFSATENSYLDYLKMLSGIGDYTAYFKENYYGKMQNWYREYGSILYNDSHTIIRFNALLHIFSFGIFHVHTVIMCFLSFLGLFCIFKLFKFSNNLIYIKAICIIYFCFPSLVFWSSGVLKESLLLFALGLISYNLFNWQNISNKYISILIILGCFFILSILKFYILMAFLPGFIAYIFLSTNSRYYAVKFSTIVVIILLLGVNFQYIIPSINVYELFARKQQDFICLAEYMNSGSMVSINKLEPNLWSFIISLPMGLFNVLFEPNFFSANGALQYLAAIENIFILLLLILILLKINHTSKTHLPFFCISISFIVILFVIIGLVTPVSGAIVRYKIPAIPFLVWATSFFDIHLTRKIF